MHICFITNEYPKLNFPHGGVGTFVKTFGHYLVNHGHKVTVIGINNYTKKNETENDNGVFVYRLSPKRVKGLTWLLNNLSVNSKIKSIHRTKPIDIIETAELGLAFIKKIKPIKFVIRLHGGHHFFSESENRKVTWWKGYQEKKSFRNADGFIAVSNFVKSHTEKYLSYNSKPLAVISSPVNTSLFKPENTRGKVNQNNITFVGTVCEKKGIRQLIIAMEDINKIYPEMKLNIYGRDWFYKDGRSYTKMLHENYSDVIKECVNFHDVVPYKDIPEVYSKANICVFPSHMETQGLVALEAMLMQKPVIFTKKGPGPELIENEITGVLCDPNNPEDIKEKILWIINHPTKSKAIAENGRKFAKNNYNIGVLAEKNLNFYKNL